MIKNTYKYNLSYTILISNINNLYKCYLKTKKS